MISGNHKISPETKQMNCTKAKITG